jgi:hypothetical protein
MLRGNEFKKLLKEVKRSGKSSYRGGTKKEPFEYSGSDDSLNRWIDAIELFFFINSTPSKLHYSVAKQYLKGNALLVIELYDRQQKAKHGRHYERMSWADLKKKLHKEFNNEMAVFTLDSMYQRRTQGDKESARDYIDCIMDMGSRLGKESNDIKSRIIAGFRADIHDRVRLHAPKSLQHLRNIAEIIESGVQNERKAHRRSQISKVDIPTDIDSICTVTKMVNEPFVKQLEALTKTVESLQVAKAHSSTGLRSRSPSPHSKTCYECASSDHLVRDCPKFKARSDPKAGQESKSENYKKRFFRPKNKKSNSSSDKSETDTKAQPQSWAPGPPVWPPPPAYQSWGQPWYNPGWPPQSMPPPQQTPPVASPATDNHPITNPPASRQNQGNV